MIIILYVSYLILPSKHKYQNILNKPSYSCILKYHYKTMLQDVVQIIDLLTINYVILQEIFIEFFYDPIQLSILGLKITVHNLAFF